MSETAPDRANAMLAELAEMDLALARKVHAAAMAAEAPDEVAELSRAYQRVARSVRQTLALKSRLQRERARAAAERPTLAEPSVFSMKRRIIALHQTVTRVIDAYTEREDERERYRDDLDEALLDLDPRTDYDRIPFDAHVADICYVLRLPAGLAARWRDLPVADDTS